MVTKVKKKLKDPQDQLSKEVAGRNDDQGPASVKRVCIISSEYPPHVRGGLGVHVDQLSTALGAFIDVDVVLPYNEEKEYQTHAKGVSPRPIAGVQASYKSSTSWLYFARYVPDKVDPKLHDIIHCHDWVMVIGGIICRWKHKIPLVYHVHLPNLSPLCSSVENLGLVCADLVTVNSDAMRREIKGRELKIRGFKIRRDIEVASPRSPDGAELAERNPGSS